MKRLAIAAVLGLLGLLACNANGASVSSSTSSMMTEPSSGFIYGVLTCDKDGIESSVFDYAEDMVGFVTIEAAIDDFRSQQTWQLREDWHGLTLGDTSRSPVVFTDQRGWVYLAVELDRLNDTWVVSGYDTCVPPEA